MKAPHRVCAALAALVLVTACGGDAASPVPPVSRIELSHLTRIVFVDDQITIEVYAFNSQSQRLTTPMLAWSSDDPAIATVDAMGRVTGKSSGSVTIRASGGDVEGSIRIDVRPAVLAIIRQEGPASLVIGESAIYRAEFLSTTGKPLPVPANVTWTTGDRDLVDLAPVPGLDASHVRVTGLAMGLASLSVGVEAKQFVEIVGVVPERVPNDGPLRVDDFYFFAYSVGYMPTMRVAVSPGRTVELMRVEVAFPGMLPKLLPPLCSSGKLTGGQHSLLGLMSYPTPPLHGYSSVPVYAYAGAALLTYRIDDGRVIRSVVRGAIDVWGYGSGYPSQFPWNVCST